MYKIKRALISVSDKRNLKPLVDCLKKHSVEIISTGGTAKVIEEIGAEYTPIEQVTGKPEAFQGRMKSISFEVASSLLFKRDDESDLKDAEKLNIDAIDLVVVNLYPFEETYKSCKDLNILVEKIDIGGPTMLRSAAKNHKYVAVLSDPDQYESFVSQMNSNKGATEEKFRQDLALEAFRLSARYESAISSALDKEIANQESEQISTKHFAAKNLRYGENPHQYASLLVNPSETNTLAAAQALQGKELSYNNYVDADAAWRSCSDLQLFLDAERFDLNGVSIIKHANPCGLAAHREQETALQMAWSGDPVSSFGSVLCFSSEVTRESATFLKDKFIEMIIAPKFSEGARSVFSVKKQLRLLEIPLRVKNKKEWMLKSIGGGVLVQEEDGHLDSEFQQVTKLAFPQDKLQVAKFSSLIAKHLKSNAIALAREYDGGFQMLGGGMGQPNRIDCIRRLAVPRSGDYFNDINYDDVVLSSDAFFPFADSIEVCNEFGIKFIVQPGGSIRDEEVIAACDKFGISMCLTKKRHFRH